MSSLGCCGAASGPWRDTLMDDKWWYLGLAAFGFVFKWLETRRRYRGPDAPFSMDLTITVEGTDDQNA